MLILFIIMKRQRILWTKYKECKRAKEDSDNSYKNIMLELTVANKRIFIKNIKIDLNKLDDKNKFTDYINKIKDAYCDPYLFIKLTTHELIYKKYNGDIIIKTDDLKEFKIVTARKHVIHHETSRVGKQLAEEYNKMIPFLRWLYKVTIDNKQIADYVANENTKMKMLPLYYENK